MTGGVSWLVRQREEIRAAAAAADAERAAGRTDAAVAARVAQSEARLSDVRARALPLYREGRSLRATAEAVGEPYTTVHRALAGHIRPRWSRVVVPLEAGQRPRDVIRPAAVRMRASGLSVEAIARQVEVSPQTVERALRDAGVLPRSVRRAQVAS